MIKKLAILVVLVLLGWQQYQIIRLGRDIDHVYAFVNSRVVGKVNEERDALMAQRDAIMFLRSEIADIMIELTREGLLEEAPPDGKDPLAPVAPHV